MATEHVIKLGILRWEEEPTSSRKVVCKRDFCKKEENGSVSKGRSYDKKVGLELCSVQLELMSQARNTNSLQNLQKARKWVL